VNFSYSILQLTCNTLQYSRIYNRLRPSVYEYEEQTEIKARERQDYTTH